MRRNTFGILVLILCFGIYGTGWTRTRAEAKEARQLKQFKRLLVRANEKLIDCEYCMQNLIDCEELKAVMADYISKLEAEAFNKGWWAKHKFEVGVAVGIIAETLFLWTAVQLIE
jgi:hypothetical protein